MKAQQANKQRGSVSVETALFLLLFLGFYLTILDVGRLAYAEVVMQQALDASAMQISQYSYILTKLGVVDQLNKTSEEASDMKTDMKTVWSGITDVYSAFTAFGDINVSEDTDIEDTLNQFDTDVKNLESSLDGAKESYNIASEYFNDTDGLVKGLLAIGKESLEQEALKIPIAIIAKGQIESYLESVTDRPDAYLKKLGIVNGLDGIDYQYCSYAADNTQDVYITIEFEVENPVTLFGKNKRKVRLSASTRLW